MEMQLQTHSNSPDASLIFLGSVCLRIKTGYGSRPLLGSWTILISIVSSARKYWMVTGLVFPCRESASSHKAKKRSTCRREE